MGASWRMSAETRVLAQASEICFTVGRNIQPTRYFVLGTPFWIGCAASLPAPLPECPFVPSAKTARHRGFLPAENPQSDQRDQRDSPAKLAPCGSAIAEELPALDHLRHFWRHRLFPSRVAALQLRKHFRRMNAQIGGIIISDFPDELVLDQITEERLQIGGA